MTQATDVPAGKATGLAPVLELAGVVKQYPPDPPVTALADIDLRIGPGELAAIIGPSGSGKSTLLHVMGTLERPSRGVVRVAGEDTSAMSDTQLSGGEQQRTAIARALAGRPALVMADEPTGNLDTATGAALLDLLRELHRDGTTIVIITHDHDVAAAMERRIEIRDGRIIRDTPTGT